MRKNLSSTLFRTALTVAMSAALAVILPAELFGQSGGALAATEPWTCNQCTGDEHNHEVTVGAGEEISGGTFKQTVTVENGGKISGGTFNWHLYVKAGGEVSNVTSTSGFVSVETGGKITGGTFKKPVYLEGGTIEGGTFESYTTVNSGTIVDGTFKQFGFNKGIINGGFFNQYNSKIYNEGTINNGTFYDEVLNEASGTVAGGTFHSKVTNKGRITGGTFNAGFENMDGGTDSLTGNSPEPSSTPTVPKNTGTFKPVHTHSYSWVTVQDASVGQDGIEEYRCSCGDVQERCVIPASAVAVKGLYGAVKDAPQGGTATFDSGRLYTLSDYVIKKLAERTDVTTVITFEYQNQAYKMTIPAGVDYTPLLSDGDYFYGYFYFANAVGATIEAAGV